MFKLYHVSLKNLNNQLLKPRIPENYFTKIGLEDNKTARVCVAKNIQNCLMALNCNLKGKLLYVHVVLQKPDLRIYFPNTDEVPDVAITNEIWALDAVQMKLIAKIKVVEPFDQISHEYGLVVKWRYFFAK